MSPLAGDLDNVLRSVDPQTALLLERAVRDSVALAQRRHESQGAVDALGYPVGYFEATSGSFAHEPLDVPPDLPLQVRESW
jgi:hypothetical protein